MKNELKHLDEFQKILENYKISVDSREILKRGNLITLTAATGVGRNTIINELVKSGKYRFLISDTTRHPRLNNGVMEKDGTTYWFKSEQDVLERLKKSTYIAPAIIHSQQVSAIGIDEVVKTYNENKIPITEIEVKGVEDLSIDKPDLIAIFVIPPDFDTWMDRLKKRGKMSQVEFKNRLVSAVKEFNYAIESNKFTFIINNNFINTVENIENMLSEHRAYMDKQKSCLQLASKLLNQTKNLLSTLD